MGRQVPAACEIFMFGVPKRTEPIESNGIKERAFLKSAKRFSRAAYGA
jgi:hypothetical protein